MTPLIQEMVSLSPEDAIEFQWFDATAVYKDEAQITPELLSYPMPFPMTAIVYQQHDGLKILLLGIRHSRNLLRKNHLSRTALPSENSD